MENKVTAKKGVFVTGVHPLISSLLSIKNSLISKNATPELIKVALKEELQNHVLYALYNNKETKDLVFYGGTCLRKIYGLNRFSEDLDFEMDKDMDLTVIAEIIERYFKGLEYPINYSIQTGVNISRVTFKFPVLYDLGLANTLSENLHVKVEINRLPKIKFPAEKTPLMHNQLSMFILHYDIETLMAGKILACLNRVYKKGKTDIAIKGRDYYDLIWYMQQNIKPNENKLFDFDSDYNITSVFDLLDKKVAKISFQDLYADLAFLFENQEFIKEWCENFQELYKKYRKNYSFPKQKNLLLEKSKL